MSKILLEQIKTSPEDRKDKLTIRGLPLYVSNEEVALLLTSKDIVLSSAVKFACMRDENGALRSYKNGDRYVYCEPFEVPIQRKSEDLWLFKFVSSPW